MQALIKPFLDICLLRIGPQDLPASSSLKSLSLALYATTGFLSGIMVQPVNNALQSTIVDTLLLVILSYLALWIKRRPERASQTITALAGCGALLSLISLPLLTMYSEQGAGQGIVELLLLGLMCWQIVIYSHILKHALAITYMLAVVIVIFYIVIMIFIMGMIASS